MLFDGLMIAFDVISEHVRLTLLMNKDMSLFVGVDF